MGQDIKLSSQERSPSTVTLPTCNTSGKLIIKDASGRKAPQYIAALTASLAALSMGTTLAWTSQISKDLRNGSLGFTMTEDELGWVGSLMHLGAAALSLFIGSLSDLIGRKLCMISLVLPATLGWSLMIWAKTVEMLYCGRFITGMVAGAFCVLSLLYSTEIAQKEIRGALGSYTQLMISGGILFANVVATFLDVRSYTATCAAIPLIFGVLFIFMPETPIYLIKKEKMQSARNSLIRLRGVNYDVEQEIKEIQIRLNECQSKVGKNSVKESLMKSSCQKACIVGFGLMIFKSTNGIEAITAYTSYIFDSANMALDSKICTIILNIFQVITAIFQSLVVDKCGRKLLLWLSGTIISICLTIVGLSLMLKNRELISEDYNNYLAYLPLIALIVFTIAFSLGLGPIPWLMMGEIFPLEIKSLAASSASFLSWMTAFLVTKIFLVINSSWGGDIAFFIFAIITAFSVVFTLILVPETKNKSFDEIQRELG